MNRHFRYNWKVTLFCLLCLAGFVSLGSWQLSRATDKEELLARIAIRHAAVPLTALELPATGDLNGIRVSLTGSYDDEQILLLDNRVRSGKVGYEVAHLFTDDTAGTGFLVNRGFITMSGSRARLPDIPQVTRDQVQVTGRIHHPARQDYVLRADSLTFDTFPVVVQSLGLSETALSAMATLSGNPVYPYVIRLDEGQPGALPRHWPDTMMLPRQHVGYAVQWFAMAVAVCLMWLFFSFRR